MRLPKDQELIYKHLTDEWTKAFLEQGVGPMILLGVADNGMVGIASAPGISPDTVLKILRAAIELTQIGKGGIIKL